MPQTLGQVVASDAHARSEANKRGGQVLKDIQKHDRFAGFTRTYRPFEDDEDGTRGLALPPETKVVQARAEDMLAQLARELAPAIDWAATKDEANTRARADVVVGDRVLLTAVPATHLLHMEKVLADIGDAVAKLPVLPPDETWTRDDSMGLYKSAGAQTIRSEQEYVPLVLHEGNQHHPPQVKPVAKQVPKGRWTTEKYSGAVTASRKRDLEARVAALRTAFKRAREEANRSPAENVTEAHALFGYLFS